MSKGSRHLACGPEHWTGAGRSAGDVYNLGPVSAQHWLSVPICQVGGGAVTTTWVVGGCKSLYIHPGGFPGGSVVKKPPANSGDPGLIPGSGRSPGEGNGNLLQYPYLGNSTDGRAWQAAVHEVTKKSDTT